MPATTIWVTGMTYEPDGAAHAPSLLSLLLAAWETDMLTTLPVQSKGVSLAGSAATLEGPWAAEQRELRGLWWDFCESITLALP